MTVSQRAKLDWLCLQRSIGAIERRRQLDATSDNAAKPSLEPVNRPSIPFRPDIEGLRALAIVLVIFSHAGLPLFASGFIGVDIFFVLSGYLITSLLLKEIETSGRIRFARFYARRARRLLPAAMLLVAAVCLVEGILISPFVQFRVLKAALATVFYSSNLYFAHLNLIYFEQESTVSPLLHTWSLSVEEQFYLLWPVLLLALTRASKSRTGAAIALAVLAVASLGYCVWLTGANPSDAFYLLPARAWEFCAGALITMVPFDQLRQHGRVFSWLGALGVVALLACAQWTRAAIFPGYVATFPAFGTLAVLLAGAASPDLLVPRLLSTRPAQFLGGLSYSLYLWHWPALVVAQQLFPSNSIRVRLGAIAAATLLAYLTHRMIENPIRFNAFLVARSGLSLSFAVLAAFACACGPTAWWLGLNRSAQFRKFEQAWLDLPKLYDLGCGLSKPDPQVHPCFFGETANPQATVVLFGDSHAAQWYPALDQIAKAQRWKMVGIVKPGCIPLEIREDVSLLMERACEEWRQSAAEKIRELRPDLVILASASLHPGVDEKLVTDVAVWQQAARDTFAALGRMGRR